MRYSHDDVFQLYINGIQLVSTGYDWGANFKIELPDSILDTMKGGKALIAAHCENRFGGALVDFGLYAEMRKTNEVRYVALAQRLDVDSDLPQHLTAAFE